MAINRQDVSLLFGVLGGGSISGESGALIKQQLESIVSSLNNKTNSRSNRIILNLDVAGTKSRFTTGLRQVLDNLNTQKQFKLRISEINATSAINKLRSDLNAMLRTLKVDTGFSVTMGANGATSAVKEIAGDAKSAILPLNEVEAKLKEITITNQRISSNYKGLTGVLSGQSSAGNNAAQKELTRLKGLYIQLETLTTSLRTNKTQASQEEIDGVYRAQLAIQELIEKSRERIQVEGEVAAAAKKADDAQSKNLQYWMARSE